MTVKELKELLKKYDEDSNLKIEVKTFSSKAESIIDTTEEEIQIVKSEICVDGVLDYKCVYLSITIYRD